MDHFNSSKTKSTSLTIISRLVYSRVDATAKTAEIIPHRPLRQALSMYLLTSIPYWVSGTLQWKLMFTFLTKAVHLFKSDFRIFCIELCCARNSTKLAGEMNSRFFVWGSWNFFILCLCLLFVGEFLAPFALRLTLRLFCLLNWRDSVSWQLTRLLWVRCTRHIHFTPLTA